MLTSYTSSYDLIHCTMFFCIRIKCKTKVFLKTYVRNYIFDIYLLLIYISDIIVMLFDFYTKININILEFDDQENFLKAQLKLPIILLFLSCTLFLISCASYTVEGMYNEAPSSSEIIQSTTTEYQTKPTTTSHKILETAEITIGRIANTSTQTQEKDPQNKYCSMLYSYLSDHANGQSVGNTAYMLNYNEWHNACVYTVSEALRRIDIDIPISMCRTTAFVEYLNELGFKTYYQLDELLPGDICFTTNETGQISDDPTHTYIFLGWIEPKLASVFDNQVYDYDSVYHQRSIDFSFFNDKKDKPKEATAFFMRK